MNFLLVHFEDDTGKLAADLQHLCSSSVSENSFRSCISGGDEGNERVTGQNSYSKTYHSGYPAYRIRFNGMPWKGYDSLQTYGVEDLFSELSRANITHHVYRYSSSDDGSDLVNLKVYKKVHHAV